MYRLVPTFILFLYFELCFSFPPNPESAPGSKSHESITRLGVYGAVAKYLKDKKHVTGIFETDYDRIKEYFISDSDGLKRFESVINEIVHSNNEIQKERTGEAKISFNGEQIREGHYELVSLRGKIEQEAKSQYLKISAIRNLIGQYLYTLQSFYCNTNWVEMRGGTAYLDLGLKNIGLVDIATPSENTCQNSYSVQNDLGHCPNNILVVSKLTSGYKSGQDIAKPKSSHNDHGKCSHGGPADSARTRTANCGINKETPDSISSPHNHLHEDAALASIKATEHFISGDGSGLTNVLSGKLFEILFGITKKTSKSLGFVIDVTGSMWDEIIDVKSVAIRKVENPVYEPAYYVLSTFSDPENLTTGYITEYSSNIIEKINSLTVFGGDDCREYAHSGIAKGIFLSNYDSILYVFTDASSKDGDRAQEVMNLAIDKRIKTFFLLTGTCRGRRRRRSGIVKETKHRYKRQSGFDPDFYRIAIATGGTVYDVTSGNLSLVLETLLQTSFPNTSEGLSLDQVNIDYKIRPENVSNSLQFYVDNKATELQIQLTGLQSMSQVEIMYPNANWVNITTSNTSSELADIINIRVTNNGSVTGNWTITPKLYNQIILNVTGKSAVDFTYKIMSKGADGYLYKVSGNPIAGNVYTIVIQLIGDTDQLKLLSLILIDSSGFALSTFPLVKLSSSDDTIYTANISMHSENFFFKILGTDADGSILTRIKWLRISPVQVQLTLVPVYGELLVNQESELSYKIKNFGGSTESFLSKLTDNQGLSVSLTSRNHTVNATSEVQDEFTIIPTTTGNIPYTIQISLSDSNEILQSITKYLYVTSIQHPTCKVVYVEGNCPLNEETANNCSFYKWFAITRTNYSSIFLSSVTLSNNDANTELFFGNMSTTNGPLVTNVSGTCCLDIVDLYVLDTDGYLATCRLNFRDNGYATTVDNVVSDVKNATTKEFDSDDLNVVAIAVGVSAAVVVVIILIVLKLIVQHFGSSAKVKDPSILYSTPKAPDKVMSVHFNPSALDKT